MRRYTVLVTYRDDHEAAVQRADALERELDESKQERDRLQAEIEHMRQVALVPSPPTQLQEDVPAGPVVTGRQAAIVLGGTAAFIAAGWLSHCRWLCWRRP